MAGGCRGQFVCHEGHGLLCVFFQAEDGIRDPEMSRVLGDVYKRQSPSFSTRNELTSIQRRCKKNKKCSLRSQNRTRDLSITTDITVAVSYTHLPLPTNREV